MADFMYKFSQITTLHIEASSFCNAKCPMCARNQADGTLNPRLKQQSMDLAQVKHHFPRSFVAQLEKVMLCGNFGDPMAAQDVLEICQYFRECQPDLNLQVHSNGGLRDSAIWKKLASIASSVVFAIDGLEDTNHIYRVGVSWQKLMENVHAFLEAGGRAEWHYLVFAHNEHQVEAAREFSKTLGFKKFQAKSTQRFLGQGMASNLKPPQSDAFKNSAYEKASGLKKTEEAWEDFLNTSQIHCKVAHEKSIYISASLEVYPCCWLGQELDISSHDFREGSLTQLMKQAQLSRVDLSLRQRSLQQIVESSFFETLIEASWQRKSLREGKLRTCSRICSKDLDLFKAQFL